MNTSGKRPNHSGINDFLCQIAISRRLANTAEYVPPTEFVASLQHQTNAVASQLPQSKIHAREQPAHISAQRDAMPVRDHSSSQSDHLARRRIGADNDHVSDSFDMADMGNTSNIQVTGDVASGNTGLTHAFNKAQMGNISGPDVEQMSGGASTDRTVHTTIASHNSHLDDVFEGAEMVNISSPQSSVFVASGNKNMSRSFNGARLGNAVRADPRDVVFGVGSAEINKS